MKQWRSSVNVLGYYVDWRGFESNIETEHLWLKYGIIEEHIQMHPRLSDSTLKVNIFYQASMGVFQQLYLWSRSQIVVKC